VSRYAAFLRGINLGPRRKISGADLRSLFEGMGLQDVATFRTSGNVVFAAAGESPGELTGRIESGLAESVGFEVAAFLRTDDEVRAIAEQRPFDPGLVEASAGKLQVALLTEAPAASARKEVLGLATNEDRLALGARELYWLPSGGIRDSALNHKAIERLLGTSTVRTKGTMEALAAKYFG
jgi:uncharacterized protein (DUF1697 family)